MENTFGILVNRFWYFLTSIAVVPETAIKLVLASCVLHNFLRTDSPRRYTPTGTCDIELIENGQIRPGEWRNEKKYFWATGAAGRKPMFKWGSPKLSGMF